MAFPEPKGSETQRHGPIGAPLPHSRQGEVTAGRLILSVVAGSGPVGYCQSGGVVWCGTAFSCLPPLPCSLNNSHEKSGPQKGRPLRLKKAD